MRIFIVSFAVAAMTTSVAHAGSVAVPEISAVGGLAAVGAVGAVVAYLWERRRKR